MDNSPNNSYESAGVSLSSGYRAVELIRKHAQRTKTRGVLSSLGGFGGMFMPDLGQIDEPVLVSGTDGVGTKLKLAFLLDKHDTIGVDCVAMCANDIICSGAKPLFFLDYIACGKNIPERIESIVKGIADGCVEAGAALIGGETAEMPGFYDENEYDLAGFCVGIVDKKKIIADNTQREGDVLLALPSSGVHSNGFSLVRSIFPMTESELTKPSESLNGQSLGECLLSPTRIYVKPILALLGAVEVKGLAHITGGGFYENIPRAVKKGLGAFIDKSALRIHDVFSLIAKTGGIDEHGMFNTFNMGVGMCAIVAKAQADKALELLKDEGAYVMGELRSSEKGVIL